mgnify:CR=1 FL=1
MGYYTDFQVRIKRINNVNEGLTMVEKLFGPTRVRNASDSEIELYSFNGKWYGWKEECVEASYMCPHAIIEIKAEGEETGDIWKARVQNGNVEIVEAKITFEKFKEII